MRHGTSQRRQRGRGNSGNGNGNSGRRGGPHRAQVYDSNGPDVRIRGTAHQVTEKYMTLAKDAAAAGDRVLAESYLQHAEHYQRIISTFNEGVQGQRPAYHSDRFDNNAPESGAGPGNEAQEGDLSLPASILGAAPKAASEQARERTEDFAAT